jgi:hypothetical protein
MGLRLGATLGNPGGPGMSRESDNDLTDTQKVILFLFAITVIGYGQWELHKSNKELEESRDRVLKMQNDMLAEQKRQWTEITKAWEAP